jgi:hydroxypyruvate reductase
MRDSSILFGYDVRLYSDKLCGEAKEEAEKLALFAKQFIAAPLTRPTALLAGGETTVTLSGNGLGGRNQELALAFALAAERIDLPGNWTFLSAGTDGRDGPTDAAGAIIEPNSLKRMRDSAIMPEQMLANNDSYHALKISRDLLITGATGTNVADLQILLINPFN